MIATMKFTGKAPALLAMTALLSKGIATMKFTGKAPALLAVTALLLLATSCSILPEREPSRIYEPLRAAQPDSAAWPQANWSLVVAKPQAGQLLDTDSISVRPSPGVVQVYKNANWSDPVPDLLQTALLRSFEDSGKITAVSRPGSGVRGQYQLVTELRTFDSIYVTAGQPQAEIEVYAKLIRQADGQVVAARSFKEVEPSQDETVEAVVSAFSRALDRLSGQLAGWTLRNGNQHEKSAVAPATRQ